VRKVAVLVAALFASAAGTANAGSWKGTFRLPAAAEPVQVSVQLDARRAAVSLGPGHSGRTIVSASAHGAKVTFALPGGVTFAGARTARTISGTVRQGSLRGTFRLTPGESRVLPALGLYRSADGAGVAIVQAAGLPTWLVELPSGDVHGLNADLTTVGTRLGDTSGNGTLAVTPNQLVWTRGSRVASYERVRLRQREVRVGAIAATLTLPPGAGPFPAVVMSHGSGPNARDEFQVFAAVCELLGIAVIADDKRGIGQSGGRYPGERATTGTVDVLARDAQAEARYLAKLPQIDPKRVGIMGDSQAGWIIALAAAREPALRWAVPLAGPTVTVDETDAWGTLAGKGQAAPSGSTAEMLAQVRAQGPGGFDPAPWLRKLSIPVFWVFTDDDRNVPTELCVERLTALKPGHDFTWTIVHATHSLFDLPGGLNSALPRTRGFAVGMWAAIGDWLRAHAIV
jgi:dienelactone hydrolase